MVWMTIVSQLGYYKLLYGPQVLLQMNIAYFLPSIPLLGLSSFYDERLDHKFGMRSLCWFQACAVHALCFGAPTEQI